MPDRMSEYITERMSDRMSEYYYTILYICHTYIQTMCQNHLSRWITRSKVASSIDAVGFGVWTCSQGQKNNCFVVWNIVYFP